jgi:hypothetical protein
LKIEHVKETKKKGKKNKMKKNGGWKKG